MGVFSIFSGFHLNDSFPYLDPEALKSWKVPNRWGYFSPKKIGWEPDLAFRKNKANLPDGSVFFLFNDENHQNMKFLANESVNLFW